MTAAVAVACVYPFEPELEKTGERLVIEGNIILGEVCDFNLSYMQYLDNSAATSVPESDVYVEAADGTTYHGRHLSSLNRTYTIDLSNAKGGQDYRLHVILGVAGDRGTEKPEYVSEWQQPSTPPIIDELRYYKEEDKVSFDISLHSNDGNQYFFWSFDEVWEFASYYSANVWYKPVSEGDSDYKLHPNGMMVRFQVGEGNHYCWRYASSNALMFTSTAALSDNIVTEKKFYSIPDTDERLTIAYSMTVKVRSMSEDAFIYWQTLSNNSDKVGDLFSPTPSEVRGNLHNLNDESELVLGYVGVSQIAEKRIVFTNDETEFYRYVRPSVDEAIEVPEDEWRQYYYFNQYRPISRSESGGYYWAEGRCVDCEMDGGSKSKPSWWPNDHV